jgi:hypothetical protein
MASEKNNLMSRLAFMNFVSTIYPLDYQYGQQPNTQHWRPIRLGTFENEEEHTGMTDDIIASMTHANCKLLLTTGMKAAHLKQAERLRANLAADPITRAEAAWLLSSSSSSMSFITSTIGITNPSYFREDDYICAVRAMLGQGPTNNPSTIETTCSCRKRVIQSHDPLHAVACTASRSFWKTRHDLIRDALHRVLVKVYPQGAPLTEVYLGNTSPNHLGETNGIVADITLSIQAQNIIIDVSIVSPSSNLYISPVAASSATHQDAASKAQETAKRAHYATLAPPHTPHPSTVIPFVLESSGRLGPAALAFILKILPSQTFIRSRFLKEAALICSRSIGQILRTARDKERRPPINGAYAPMPG